MTPEQIKDFAAEAGFHPYYTEVSAFHINLVRTFAKLIEAATREECAEKVKQDLYPDDENYYIRQYNYGIKALAEKIRSGT